LARLTGYNANQLDRLFLPAALLILAVMATVQIGSIRQEAQTFDEGTHLAAGLSYWKTGDYRMNPEHPPLGKLLCALPLLFTDVRLPFEYPSWDQKDELNFGAEFLYTNKLSADQILFPARCVTIVLTLLLGAALAFWTRMHFGSASALLALTFFAFDPNLIAHGRYVTTDFIVALFSFVACVMWGAVLQHATPLKAIAAGVALGLALASKFSALFLIPVFLVLALIRWPGWKTTMLVALIAYITLLVPYIPDLFHHPGFIPDSYRTGWRMLLDEDTAGRPAYLFGMISQKGWWYYFPFAFLVKAPTGFVALTLLGLVLLLLKRPKLPFEMIVLAVAALVYWAFCLNSHIDLGIRHLLPAYVVMIPLFSVIALRYAPKWLVIALTAILLIESLSIYPHYLAFFNWPSGGASNGPRYLVDSNIDWGQDTKKLKAWLDARNIHQVCRVYFGVAVFAHYGIGELPLPGTDEIQERANLDCIAAASVTALYGPFFPVGKYRWLRERAPIAKIGYSIYMYDLRKPVKP